MGPRDLFRRLLSDRQPPDNVLRGYKRAYLTAHALPGEWRPSLSTLSFVSQVGFPYGKDSVARCYVKPEEHTPDMVPVEDCKCGFHALRERTDIANFIFAGGEMRYNDPAAVEPTAVLLEVALWGRVIEGTTGYRASRQKIFAVDFPGVCALCDNPASAIGWTPVSPYNPYVPAPLYSVCYRCSEKLGVVTFTPAEIGSALGVEVRFDPSVAPSAQRADIPVERVRSGALQLLAMCAAFPFVSILIALLFNPYPSGLGKIVDYALRSQMPGVLGMLIMYMVVLSITSKRTLAAISRVSRRLHFLTAVAALMAVLIAIPAALSNTVIRRAIAAPPVASVSAELGELAEAVASSIESGVEPLAPAVVAYAALWRDAEPPLVVGTFGSKHAVTGHLAPPDGYAYSPSVFYDEATRTLILAEPTDDGRCRLTTYPLPDSVAEPSSQLVAVDDCTAYPYS